MISRLYLNLQEQIGVRLVVYGTGATSMRDRDRDQDSYPITTWVVRVTDELGDGSVIYDDVDANTMIPSSSG